MSRAGFLDNEAECLQLTTLQKDARHTYSAQIISGYHDLRIRTSGELIELAYNETFPKYDEDVSAVTAQLNEYEQKFMTMLGWTY